MNTHSGYIIGNTINRQCSVRCWR